MSENPLELMISGAKYIMEIVNFMMFISEEGCQASSMAFTTAMENLKLDLAQEIADTTLVRSNQLLEEWVLSYGLLFAPSWNAFWCFGYANDSQNTHIISQMLLYKEYVKQGIDPRSLKMKQRIL